MGDTAAHPNESTSPWRRVASATRHAGQLIDCLLKRGLNPAVLDHIVDDPTFCLWAVTMLNSGRITTPPGEAVKLMTIGDHIGRHFIDIDEATRLLGLTISAKQVRQIGDIPFPVHSLTSLSLLYSLVPGLPVSIQELKALLPRMFSFVPIREEAEWMTEKVPTSWHMVGDHPIDSSRGRTFEEQKRLLRPYETVPLAATYVYMLLIQALAVGRKSANPVRCLAAGLDDGETLSVSMNGGKISINIVPSSAFDNLGIAAEAFRVPSVTEARPRRP